MHVSSRASPVVHLQPSLGISKLTLNQEDYRENIVNVEPGKVGFSFRRGIEVPCVPTDRIIGADLMLKTNF
jgi:hypothetical protein